MYKVLFVLFLLVACTPGRFESSCPGFDDPQLQHLMPADKHTVLAKKHELLYNEYSAKLAEHKLALQDFEEHKQYYGRSGLDFEGHTNANILYYERLVFKANEQISYHKHMATILSKQPNNSTSN